MHVTRLLSNRRAAGVGFATVALCVVALVASGVALALSYEVGTYKEGAQSGFKAPGIRIDIRTGSFVVERILMHEVCTAPGKSPLYDFGGFQRGSRAKLAGRINRSTGRFSGKFVDNTGGYTNVSGHIQSSTLTVVGSEASGYAPPGSTVVYHCTASGRFHPKRS